MNFGKNVVIIVGVTGDPEMKGKCMRCQKIADVKIYKDNESICHSCQRIWFIMLEEARKQGKAKNAYSDEFIKLRKLFLNNDNPSRR